MSLNSLTEGVRTFDPENYLKCKQYLDSVRRLPHATQPSQHSLAFSSLAMSLPSTPQRSTAAASPECLESIAHPPPVLVVGDSPPRQQRAPLQPQINLPPLAAVNSRVLPISVRFVYEQLQRTEQTSSESVSLPASARSSPSTTSVEDSVRYNYFADDALRSSFASSFHQRGDHHPSQQWLEEFHHDCRLRREQRAYNEATARSKLRVDFLLGLEPKGRAAIEAQERNDRQIVVFMKFEGASRDLIERASCLHVALWLQVDELGVTETHARTRVTENEVVCRHSIDSLRQMIADEAACRRNYEGTVLHHRAWDLCFPVMYTHETVRRDVIACEYLGELEVLLRREVVISEELAYRDVPVRNIVCREDAHRRQIAWYESKTRRRIEDSATYARHVQLVLLGNLQHALDEVVSMEATMRRYLAEKSRQRWIRLVVEWWMTRANDGRHRLQVEEQDEWKRFIDVEAEERRAFNQQQRRAMPSDASPSKTSRLDQSQAATQETNIAEGDDHRAPLLANRICSSGTAPSPRPREVGSLFSHECQMVPPSLPRLLGDDEHSEPKKFVVASVSGPTACSDVVDVGQVCEPPAVNERLAALTVDFLFQDHLRSAHSLFLKYFAAAALLTHRVVMSVAEGTARLRLVQEASVRKDYLQRISDLLAQECSTRVGVAATEHRDAVQILAAAHRVFLGVAADDITRLTALETSNRRAVVEEAVTNLERLQDAAVAELSIVELKQMGADRNLLAERNPYSATGSCSSSAVVTLDHPRCADSADAEGGASRSGEVLPLLRPCAPADECKYRVATALRDSALLAPPIPVNRDVHSRNGRTLQEEQDSMERFWWSLAEIERSERVLLENRHREERASILVRQMRLPMVAVAETNSAVAVGRLDLHRTQPAAPPTTTVLKFQWSRSRNDKALERWVASKR